MNDLLGLGLFAIGLCVFWLFSWRRSLDDLRIRTDFNLPHLVGVAYGLWSSGEPLEDAAAKAAASVYSPQQTGFNFEFFTKLTAEIAHHLKQLPPPAK